MQKSHSDAIHIIRYVSRLNCTKYHTGTTLGVNVSIVYIEILIFSNTPEYIAVHGVGVLPKAYVCQINVTALLGETTVFKPTHELIRQCMPIVFDRIISIYRLI